MVRGVLAPIDILPAASAFRSFGGVARTSRLGNGVKDLGINIKTGMKNVETDIKTSIKYTETKVKTGIKHVETKAVQINDAIVTATQQGAVRIKNANAVVKERVKEIPEKLANKAVDAAKVVDEAVTNTKTLFSNSKIEFSFEGGAPKQAAKNTYSVENTMKNILDQVPGINIGDKGVISKGLSNSNKTASQSLSNLDEAHQWGSKHFDHWVESLTDSEKNAIKQYTGNDYRKINNYLRGFNNSLEGVDLKVIDEIKSGLNKASTPHDIQVYRGTDLRPFRNLYKTDDDGKIITSSLVGKTIKDDGFVSTAMVKKSSFDHMGVSWEINVPKGTNAAYVGKISHYPNEAELLLNSGQEMVIKSASVDSNGKIHLVLNLIK